MDLIIGISWISLIQQLQTLLSHCCERQCIMSACRAYNRQLVCAWWKGCTCRTSMKGRQVQNLVGLFECLHRALCILMMTDKLSGVNPAVRRTVWKEPYEQLLVVSFEKSDCSLSWLQGGVLFERCLSVHDDGRPLSTDKYFHHLHDLPIIFYQRSSILLASAFYNVSFFNSVSTWKSKPLSFNIEWAYLKSNIFITLSNINVRYK